MLGRRVWVLGNAAPKHQQVDDYPQNPELQLQEFNRRITDVLVTVY